MGEKVTLQHPDTGRRVTTDNAEAASNLQYGRGFQAVAEPGRPAVPHAEAAPAETPPVGERPAGHGQDATGPAVRGLKR